MTLGAEESDKNMAEVKRVLNNTYVSTYLERIFFQLFFFFFYCEILPFLPELRG